MVNYIIKNIIKLLTLKYHFFSVAYYYYPISYLDSISFCPSINLSITTSSDFSNLVLGFLRFQGLVCSASALFLPSLGEGVATFEFWGLPADVSQSSVLVPN